MRKLSGIVLADAIMTLTIVASGFGLYVQTNHTLQKQADYWNHKTTLTRNLREVSKLLVIHPTSNLTKLVEGDLQCATKSEIRILSEEELVSVKLK
ncbi:hypothetical protein [Dellaglioa carnosa]|uniref:Uncharacterized protein n=1 Tax=Dellaglioa carnosa TaxID=2995136 RepID=A0ABT4JNN7_9LACO|nr:hypothetical protein [Dellaglioa carnosa]MCZ2491885.1 hypothetical protein [Dellaglioa carnosa]MCZ2494899.1 hypothetical protein [Dellaglioa carnosa]MDK1731762.1 hypothetical protein [Dellaglioa carnosa]